MRVTSIASSGVSGGRIVGSRRASIVFPAPGGPSMMTLWPPAAAISSARRAWACPRTSERSPAIGGIVGAGLPAAGSGRIGSRPRSLRAISDSEPTGWIGTPCTSPASLAFAWGTSRPRPPRSRTASAMLRTPGTGRTVPSRESSPIVRRPSSAPGGIWWVAARSPRAIGRSNAEPSLRVSAGARLTVIRLMGTSYPEFRTAARTRSRASRTPASGSPTAAKVGIPGLMSTSTSTTEASNPTTAALCTRASTTGSLAHDTWKDVYTSRSHGERPRPRTPRAAAPEGTRQTRAERATAEIHHAENAGTVRARTPLCPLPPDHDALGRDRRPFAVARHVHRLRSRRRRGHPPVHGAVRRQRDAPDPGQAVRGHDGVHAQPPPVHHLAAEPDVHQAVPGRGRAANHDGHRPPAAPTAAVFHHAHAPGGRGGT